MSSRLVRPRDDKMIAGVCSGLARRFGMDKTLIRVLFLVSLLLPGPQVLVYIALWIIMPREAPLAYSAGAHPSGPPRG